VADDEAHRETFQQGDLLYIQILLDRVWPNRSENEKVYVLLLSKDGTQTRCLCPSSIAPVAEITCSNFLIPDKAPKKCLRVEGPRGIQSILALMTQRPLTPEHYREIESGEKEALDRIARDVSQNSYFEWQLLQKDYEVL